MERLHARGGPSEELRRSIAQKDAVDADNARQMVKITTARIGATRPIAVRQQRLRRNWGDHREIGGCVGSENAELKRHDCPRLCRKGRPNGAGPDRCQDAGTLRNLPRPSRDAKTAPAAMRRALEPVVTMQSRKGSRRE